MTRAQAEKIKRLRMKCEAGVTIKESEWFPWQKTPKTLRYEDTRSESEMRHLYLAAIGKSEDDANPNALYWDAYDALERGESCGTCGRPGETTCRPCATWLSTIMDRPRVRRAIRAA